MLLGPDLPLYISGLLFDYRAFSHFFSEPHGTELFPCAAFRTSGTTWKPCLWFLASVTVLFLSCQVPVCAFLEIVDLRIMLFLHLLYLALCNFRIGVPVSKPRLSVFRSHVPVLLVSCFRKREAAPLVMAVAAVVAVFFNLSVRIWFHLFQFLFGKIYLFFFVPFGSIHALQFGFLLLNDKVVSVPMLLTCDSLWLPRSIRGYRMQGSAWLVISSLSLWLFPVHGSSSRKRYGHDSSVLNHLFPTWKLSLSPLPADRSANALRLCAGNLSGWCPSVFGTLHQFAYICQCGVRSDKQYSFTDGEHPATLIIFRSFLLRSRFPAWHVRSFPWPSAWYCHNEFAVRVAEVGIYPLFVIGGKFGNDIDSGLADITHVFGSSPVVSPLDAMLQGLICMLDFVAIFLKIWFDLNFTFPLSHRVLRV